MPPALRAAPSPSELGATLLDVVDALVVAADPDGRIVVFNRACEKATGYRGEEARGRRIWDFLLIPEEAEAVKAVFSRLRAGEARNRFENDWVARDGSRRRIVWSNTVLTQPDGTVSLVIGTGLDVTELRKLEEERAQALARAQGILDAAVDPIITIHESGIVESVNCATERVFGYAVHELVGKRVSLLMPWLDPGGRGDAPGTHVPAGAERLVGSVHEGKGRRADGTSFPLDLSLSEVSLREKRFFTAIVRDLTQRKRAEERAQAAEELASIGTLAAAISHEIGSPLNVVRGYAEMIERNATDEATRKRAYLIGEQAQRVTRLLQCLINIARPHELRFARVRLSDVLELSIGFLAEKLRARRIRVERCFDRVPSVRGDPEKLQQLFLNLFLNAIDAMPRGGRLRLALRRRDRQVEAAVGDTGSGIPPDDLGRLFEPFYTSKPRGRGNGLGLAVCKGIVTSHHGRIDVASEPGRGTEFRIFLPAAEPERCAAERASRGSLAPGKTA